MFVLLLYILLLIPVEYFYSLMGLCLPFGYKWLRQAFYIKADLFFLLVFF